MSNSPFDGRQNAYLTFEVASTRSTDPATGNRLKLEPQQVEIQAMLSEEKEPEVGRSPGVDGQAIYLEGRAVNPTELPATIRPNTWAEAIWSGNRGRFYLLLTGRSVWGVEAATGDKIRGWFVAKV
jgi:hypothetical protein